MVLGRKLLFYLYVCYLCLYFTVSYLQIMSCGRGHYNNGKACSCKLLGQQMAGKSNRLNVEKAICCIYRGSVIVFLLSYFHYVLSFA